MNFVGAVPIIQETCDLPDSCRDAMNRNFYLFNELCRGGRIRTCDLLLPKQAR
jgi:hypothetical protein